MTKAKWLLVSLIFLYALQCRLLWASRDIRVVVKSTDGITKEISLYSDYYALVIGCANYKDTMIPNLSNVEKDVKDVENLLKGLGF